MTTSLIVAASENDVIGAGGVLPWHLPEDMRRFRRLTAGHAVVLGRVTHESIVARLGRPLPGRTSVVVSSRPPAEPEAEVMWAGSPLAAVAAARAAEAQAAEAQAAEAQAAEAQAAEAQAAEAQAAEAQAAEAQAAEAQAAEAQAGGAGAVFAGEVFVLGGASVYGQALPEVDRVYLTRVHRVVTGDTSMPAGWLDGFTLVGREERAREGFSFLEYERRPG